MSSACILPCRRTSAVAIALALLLAAFAGGCSRSTGLEDYERRKKAEEDGATALRNLGGKLTKKHYPMAQRDAYTVGLAEKTLDDQTFDHLKSLGVIAELDLSKTNVTDAHMDLINQPEIGGFLIRLDLSNTSVTDAGLDKLTNLNFLTTLHLTGTKTTTAATDRLRSRLVQERMKDARTPAFMKTITIKK